MNDTDDVILFLFEGTAGEQSRRAAIVVGRFSPPTIGHYALFDAAKKYIRNNPKLNLEAVPIAVIVEGVESSKDKLRNPLSAGERISFMTASGKADGVKFLTATSAFAAFEEVRKAGFEPIAVAAGTDITDGYLGMLDTYFKTPDGGDIAHYAISMNRTSAPSAKLDSVAELDAVLKYTDDEIPVNMVSASLARHAVKENDLNKFTILVGLKDKPEIAELMFNKIKAQRRAAEK